MEKYRARSSKIEKFEVVKETEKKITYINVYTAWGNNKEQRREETEFKKSSYHNWFDTFEQAQNHLIQEQIDEIELSNKRIIRANESIESIKSIKPF